MKVGELIEMLQQYDPEAELYDTGPSRPGRSRDDSPAPEKSTQAHVPSVPSVHEPPRPRTCRIPDALHAFSTLMPDLRAQLDAA